ncbi:MAG: transglycosylase SLT domain-containing protein [Saprospiraceae bacterium]
MDTPTDLPALSGLGRLLIALLIFFPSAASAAAPDWSSEAAVEAEVDRILTDADDAVRERLGSLDQSLLEHRYDKSVRYIITRYVERWRHSSALIVGRATRYFPIFEQELAAAGLPDALKYLTITESALRGDAYSPVGAAGLWQLMPGTARELGLTINDNVDERLEPRRASAAGIEYLRRMYAIYGDWALAMAAYNSGPGRVNRAQRRSRSSDFWRLRKHLPNETSGYVPGYIAAAYLAEFYAKHDIEPILPPLELQLTDYLLIERPLSFYRIAQITGLSVETLQELNPAYLRGFVPGTPGGHYLCLPQRVSGALTDFLDRVPAADSEAGLRVFSPFISAAEGDAPAAMEEAYNRYSSLPGAADTTLTQAAVTLHLSPYQVAVWNNKCPGDAVTTEDFIQYYRPVRSAGLPTAAPPIVLLPTLISKELWEPAGPVNFGFLEISERSQSPLRGFDRLKAGLERTFRQIFPKKEPVRPEEPALVHGNLTRQKLN